MADSRFFLVSGPFTLEELAAASGATLVKPSEGGIRFRDVAPLDQAGAEDFSFLDNRKYLDAFRVSRAGGAVIHPDLADKAPPGMALLLSKDPYRAYAKIARTFYPPPPLVSGIAPTASVGEAAVLGEGCQVDAGAVIGAGVQIGSRCHIGANAVIGRGVVLGDDCVVGAGACLQCCLVGSRTTIYTGARIGQDGFGFAMGLQGHLRVPQLGRVIVGSDVEVGANTTIDRGAGPDTIIGDGCMIDNLVQIGHNVQMGRGCVIVAQVGISGSTKLGDFVSIGGQGGLTGHLSIGSGAKIAAQSGVFRDVGAGESVMGSPAMPARMFMRQVAMINKFLKRDRA